MPQIAPLPTAELRQARRTLLESGHVPAGLLNERLTRSWLRSQEAGLSPIDALHDLPLSNRDQLRQAQSEHRDFLAQAKPVMGFVFDQMQDTGSLVVLADARGLLLHSLGDTDFVSRAERVSLSPGALWHETDRGTNAIGTALADGLPVVVHGDEHYLERNSFLTCAAAPIRNSTGQMMGVLDISGDYRGRHPHTFALVRSAARMIEDRLFHARHQHDLILHLHTSPEGLGGIGEGLLALSQDGWLIGANTVAQQWLRTDGPRGGACTLEELTGWSMNQLNSGTVQRMHTRQPKPLYVRLDAPSKSVVSLMPATASTPDVAPPSSGALLAMHSADTLAKQPTTPPDTTPHATGPAADSRLLQAQQRALRVQAQGIPVLIQGASGTGKEVFARALHAQGLRAQRPFVAVNCAALPDTLIEAELFGYVGGAFTGARREGSPGRIREADGGTLFLDEIGDMPLALQARLLRVLQDKTVVPLGGGRPTPVDFVLVCATHRHLLDEIREGRFREDLYYRLNGLTLTLPALRERQDIPQLIQQVLDDICADMGRSRVQHIAADLLTALSRHPWPGNLRQLHGVLRTACALLEPRERTLDWSHIPEDVAKELRHPRVSLFSPNALSDNTLPASETDLRKLSDQTIAQVITATGGNMSEAARRLGISRNTLYRRIKQQAIT